MPVAAHWFIKWGGCRVWSRKEWQPVRCLLSAFCTKIAEDAGIRCKAAAQAELEDAVRPHVCKHCGTECRPRAVGGKHRAFLVPNTPPPAKRARSDAAERPCPSTPPTGKSRVSRATLPTQDKSPPKKTRSARGSLPPARLSVVESFCVEGSVQRYRWYRFRPLQAVLASMDDAYVGSESWQPSADAVVMVDAHWFSAEAELSDRERQMKLRKAMLALMEGTVRDRGAAWRQQLVDGCWVARSDWPQAACPALCGCILVRRMWLMCTRRRVQAGLGCMPGTLSGLMQQLPSCGI